VLLNVRIVIPPVITVVWLLFSTTPSHYNGLRRILSIMPNLQPVDRLGALPHGAATVMLRAPEPLPLTAPLPLTGWLSGTIRGWLARMVA